MKLEDYNYAHFDRFVVSGEADAMFERFKAMNHAGDLAPDGELTALGDGKSVRLSELWGERAVVLEFGSFT